MGRNIWISTSAAALLWCGVAHAQQAAPSAQPEVTDLNEIVVTAERRTTNLQKAPIAASVFTGEEIAKRGVTTVEQLQFAAPSLTVQNSGQGNSFNIRGIGKSENNSSVGVGVITYRDGVATFPAYFQNEPMYDIAAVEVLRGPQGTFAGQNATGGAVFITEKRPDFSGVGGYAQAQYGNYNDVRLQGALNLPLVADKLAARIAFNTEDRDSFFHVVQGAPTLGDPGKLKTRAVRGSLLWTPTDSLTVNFSTDYANIDLGGYPTSPVASTNALFDISTNGPFLAKDETVRSVLNVAYKFANGVTLKSITGYQWGNTAVQTDLDGTAALKYTFRDDVNQTLWSQEINLISPDTGPLTWVAGAYYQSDLIRFPPGRFVTNQGYDITLAGRNPKTTSAVFGQIGYHLTDKLELQVGGRYAHSTVLNDAVSAIPLVGLKLSQYDRTKDDAFTGKVALNYTLDDDNFLYGFVARGHKAGGINGVNVAFVPPRPFKGENVTDIEAGWKANWMGGRVRTQLGGYYNIYENFQINLGDPTVPAIASILNIDGKTKLYGLEATAQGHFGNLGVDAGLTVAHSKLADFYAADSRLARTGVCNTSTGPASGNCVNVGGNAQTYAPELTVHLGVNYNIALAGGTLTPRVDYSHISDTWTTIFANTALGDHLKARDIVNAQLSYDTGPWTLEGYATNLTDQHYIGSVKSGQRYAGAPRQYGLRVRRTF